MSGTLYTEPELYELWLNNFRGQHDATQMLMDFALCSREEARKMIRDFETRRTIERGKQYR